MFKNHYRQTHNIVHYVNYIINLKMTLPFDLNYNQSRILEGFNLRKVDIFPIHKSKDLRDYEFKEEEEDED